MRGTIATLVIILVLLIWGFFHYALPKYKVIFDKSKDSYLSKEDLEDIQGKRFRSVFWPVFLLLLCVFWGVRIVNHALEKDLVKRLNALPINIQEYLREENTAPPSGSEELFTAEERLEETITNKPDYKYYIEFPDGKRANISKETYESTKDELFSKYPEAIVYQLSPYDAEDSDTQPGDRYAVSLSDGSLSSLTHEQLEQMHAQFPDAQITKMRNETAAYWEDKYKNSRITVVHESGDENTAFFDLLDDGRTETWSLEEYNLSSRRFFIKYPSAVVVRMDLPSKYTWEIGVTSIKAPLLEVTISATVNKEHSYGNDIWLKEEEIESDYLSNDITGKLHRERIGGIHALTVTDQWERKEVMTYDYYVDFFSEDKWISINISGNNQHFRSLKQFEALAKQIQDSMRIITY